MEPFDKKGGVHERFSLAARTANVQNGMAQKNVAARARSAAQPDKDQRGQASGGETANMLEG